MNFVLRIGGGALQWPRNSYFTLFVGTLAQQRWGGGWCIDGFVNCMSIFAGLIPGTPHLLVSASAGILATKCLLPDLFFRSNHRGPSSRLLQSAFCRPVACLLARGCYSWGRAMAYLQPEVGQRDDSIKEALEVQGYSSIVRIGEGGLSLIYKAHSPWRERVAVKASRQGTPEEAELLKKEYQALVCEMAGWQPVPVMMIYRALPNSHGPR